MALVVANLSRSAETFDIEWENNHLTAAIGGESVATYCWRAP